MNPDWVESVNPKNCAIPWLLQTTPIKDCQAGHFSGVIKYCMSIRKGLTVSIPNLNTILFVPRYKSYLSSFEIGCLNIFSRQNLLRTVNDLMSARGAL